MASCRARGKRILIGESACLNFGQKNLETFFLPRSFSSSQPFLSPSTLNLLSSLESLSILDVALTYREVWGMSSSIDLIGISFNFEIRDERMRHVNFVLYATVTDDERNQNLDLACLHVRFPIWTRWKKREKSRISLQMHDLTQCHKKPSDVSLRLTFPSQSIPDFSSSPIDSTSPIVVKSATTHPAVHPPRLSHKSHRNFISGKNGKLLARKAMTIRASAAKKKSFTPRDRNVKSSKQSMEDGDGD